MGRRNIIGERVKLARRLAKPPISQADLTARLQIQGIRIERPGISKIETGYREVTDIEVQAISKALGVSISWLFGDE
jgi:HTH-type transcriptional regulator, cell division transcriptional repressor